MARSYAAELRRRVIERVRAGHSVARVAREIGVSDQTVYRWVAQDRIDRGEQAGETSRDRSELAAARRRIRELETELAIIKKTSDFYGSLDKIRPKGSTR